MSTSDSTAPEPAEADACAAFHAKGSVLAEALRCSCVELMAGYGVQATLVGGVTEPPSGLSAYIAVAEFSSENMHGSVGLRATQGVLSQTAGDAITSDSPRMLVDWTCELVNQLLGRLKNKLRSFDVTIDTQRPRLIGAERLAELERAARYRFSCEYGHFSGYLDLVLAPGFVLKKRESSEPLPEEGDVILF